MIVYLNGVDGLMVEMWFGWDVFGFEVCVVFDFGCGVNDFWGMYLNFGD